MFRKDCLSKKNRTGIWSSLYYHERWYSFFPKMWSYSLDGKGKMIFIKKKIHGNMMLSSIFWKDDFSKKLALEYYLFCNIWKDISFFQKYIFFRRKMKDDLSRKIQGNIGAQPDFFQGGGVYGKLGDFNKHFIEKKIKKAPQGKTMEFFS